MSKSRIRLMDELGLVAEKYATWLICGAYILFFLGNRLIIVIDESGIISAEMFLITMYEKLIDKNIGTITTVASVFVGTYVTILSVFGSIKASSLMSFLDSKDIKRLMKYFLTAISSSFLTIIYSIFIPAMNNQFYKSFSIFLLLIYMMLTAFRLCISIVVIYSHDIAELINDLQEEKKEKEKNRHTLFLLRKYLEQNEIERLEEVSKKMIVDITKNKQE